MRIIITSNYKLGNETGTAHIAEKLAKYLSKKNIVTYICLGEKFDINIINSKFSILKIPSIEINKIAVPLITPDIVYKVFEYLYKFKPAVIHAQNSLFISNLTQVWANLNNIPFIVTFHHIPTEALDHLFPKLSKNIISNLVQDLYKDLSLKKFLSKTNSVIALNKSVENSIRKIDKDIPINIINNGLDLNKLLKIKIKNLSKTNVNFVFIGSYNERKNQEYLIETFRYLPSNYKLNLYGNINTNKEYVNKLKLLKNLYKLNNISINNYVNDIAIVYKENDFFISASLKEAQSLAVIEALASGKPVIGLTNETLSEIINSKNGLVFQTNLSSIQFANEVIKYINLIDYKTASKNARESVNKFKIENVALKIENVYKSSSNTKRKNSRWNISNYYQEIFKSIIFKK